MSYFLYGFNRKYVVLSVKKSRHPDNTPSMTLKDRVGRRLRDLRKAQGLSQEKLAELVDRSVDAISNLERGISLPNFETLERLGTVLQVPVRDFFDVDFDEAPHRTELLTRLINIARTLGDRDLEVAALQLEALAARPSLLPSPARISKKRPVK